MNPRCALLACLATTVAAAEPAPEPPVAARALVAGGWDTNALQLEGPNQQVSDLGGAAASASALVAWRPLRDLDRSLTVAPVAGADWYADQELARQVRVGAVATGALRLGAWLPTASLGAHRFWLDGEEAADVYTGALGWNRPAAGWAALPALEVTHYDYARLEDASGTLAGLHYRHWLLPVAGDAGRRLELGARAGRYLAGADYEQYIAAELTAGAQWTWGAPRSAGGWELAADAGYEWRRYDERVPGAEAEQTDHVIGAGASLDRWFNRWLAAGAYIRGSLRESSYEWRDYDRLQAGLRLSAAY